MWNWDLATDFTCVKCKERLKILPDSQFQNIPAMESNTPDPNSNNIDDLIGAILPSPKPVDDMVIESSKVVKALKSLAALIFYISIIVGVSLLISSFITNNGYLFVYGIGVIINGIIANLFIRWFAHTLDALLRIEKKMSNNGTNP